MSADLVFFCPIWSETLDLGLDFLPKYEDSPLLYSEMLMDLPYP